MGRKDKYIENNVAYCEEYKELVDAFSTRAENYFLSEQHKIPVKCDDCKEQPEFCVCKDELNERIECGYNCPCCESDSEIKEELELKVKVEEKVKTEIKQEFEDTDDPCYSRPSLQNEEKVEHINVKDGPENDSVKEVSFKCEHIEDEKTVSN